jgi:endonuclease/exonuclease/phosphatase family metal-dependent hydrolase
MHEVRVATFNIQHGRAPTGRVDVEALAAACATLDADVLALQEVDVNVPRSGRVDEAALVAAATGMHVVFGPTFAIEGGLYGNALLSRDEISDVEHLALPVPGTREPRAAIVARTFGANVAATHFSVGTDAHPAQFDTVLGALAGRSSPRLLMGDLNQELVTLDGYDLAGGAKTWPAHRPRARLDHVAAAGAAIESVRVVRLPVSDHRAVVAVVRGGQRVN